MPTVAVVYEPNVNLGPDPLDSVQVARRLGDLITPGTDLLLIWREWGEEYPGGSRTHVVGDGIWQNVMLDRIAEAIEGLSDL